MNQSVNRLVYNMVVKIAVCVGVSWALGANAVNMDGYGFQPGMWDGDVKQKFIKNIKFAFSGASRDANFDQSFCRFFIFCFVEHVANFERNYFGV